MYSVSFHHRLFRALIRPVFRGIFRLLARISISGLENIPKQGPYIIIFNHVSIYDPALVGAFWPAAPEVLGAVDVWSRPGQGILARLYGGIPIVRGGVDRSAMESCLEVLRRGGILLISPEGTRSHIPGLKQAKPGLTYILAKVKVPLIPVGVVGTTDTFFSEAIRGRRPHLSMEVGATFYLPDPAPGAASPKESRQGQADYALSRIADLLPEDYQGFYARSAKRDRLLQTAQ
jgi:1-acyl-sn-glycerol-3-phosphate acyltransferase